METLNLEPATEADLDEVEFLLETNDLPTADVRSEDVRLFLARVDGTVVGVGGLEVYESAALLRSLAVVPSTRGQGYGSALVRALEERAVSLGATEVYLLTTSAGEFFRNCGYEEIDRKEVLQSIQNTVQFATLCPDSARCMRKGVE
jgi:amino-acid N-acetyltransferase